MRAYPYFDDIVGGDGMRGDGACVQKLQAGEETSCGNGGQQDTGMILGGGGGRDSGIMRSTSCSRRKFIQWCLPHILNEVPEVTEEQCQLGMLLIHIAHIFFSCSRKRGWSMRDIKTCRSLFSSWWILSEEYEGPNSSPPEHIAGSGEILDDILCHGSHDCYWCYSFEQSILGYLSIPTNNKANEISYTNFHSHVLFTKTWIQKEIEKDGLLCVARYLKVFHSCLLLPQGFCLDEALSSECRNWHSQCALLASSDKQARELWNTALRLLPCACKSLLTEKGIVIGRKVRRKPFLLSVNEKALVHSSKETCSYGYEYSKVFVEEVKYTIGDNLVVAGENNTKYYGRLLKIFSVEQEGFVNVFVTLSATVGSFDGVDDVSGMFVIQNSKKNQCVSIIQPANCIGWKFFYLTGS